MAGGETAARAAYHHHAGGLLLEVGDVRLQRLEERDVEGVQLVGPIESQPGRPASIFPDDQFAHTRHLLLSAGQHGAYDCAWPAHCADLPDRAFSAPSSNSKATDPKA